jgi:hypothetical protein
MGYPSLDTPLSLEGEQLHHLFLFDKLCGIFSTMSVPVRDPSMSHSGTICPLS